MRPALIASLLPLWLLGCAQPAEDARAAWLHNTLLDDNQHLLERDPDLAAGKFARMARSPYEFMRGSLPQFLRDASQPWDGQSPTRFGDAIQSQTFLVGDPHVENLGTFLHTDGRLRLGFNDFDASAYGPWIFDLRRLALSLAVTLSTLQQDAPIDLTPKTLGEFVAEGYTDELEALDEGKADPFDEDADDLGRILNKLLERAREQGDRAELRDELTQTDGPARRLRRGDLEPPTGLIIEARLLPASLQERRLVEAALLQWPHTTPQERGAPAIKDLARRLGVGVSSYPLLRWYVLLEGPTSADDDDTLLEIKEIADPLFVEGAPLFPGRAFESNAQRVVEAQRLLQGDDQHDLKLGWAQIGATPLRVRSLTSYQRGLNLSTLREDAQEGELTDEHLVRFARHAGRLLAQHHARPKTLWGEPALPLLRGATRGRKDELIEETGAFVARALPQLHEDHGHLVDLLATAGPMLGYRPWSGETR